MASTGSRAEVSAALALVVAVIDEDVRLCNAGLQGLYAAAAELAGTAPFPHATNAGGWAFPWCRGLPLPRTFDWSSCPWRLACSSLATLARVEPALRRSMRLPSHEVLLDRVVALGCSWMPLPAPPPPSAALPRLRRVWLSPAAATAWPADRAVAALLVQGPLPEGAEVRARGVSTLGLAGTSPEDLAAVAGLAPGVRELELAPTTFEVPSEDLLDQSLASLDEAEPPRLHVAPDPALFSSLQRLQARLDAQSLVILGAFAKSLPMLRRLGTVEVAAHEVGARLAWLPRGLEECVLAVVGEQPAGGDRWCGLWRTGMACMAQIRDAPSLQCSCLHLCFVPEVDEDLHLAFRTLQEVYRSDKRPRTVSLSLMSPPAESTPLDRPVPRW